MLIYTYSLDTSAPAQPGELQRTLFGITATLALSAPNFLNGEWPTATQSVVLLEVPQDSSKVLDNAAQAWIDAAAPGPKLDILFRSVRMLWKSGRAYVQCPATLRSDALTAVLDYALLANVIATLEARALALAQALVGWQARPEASCSIAPLRAQLAEATQCALQLVALRPYCELPARTGDMNTGARMRTEWLTQAQTIDALGLVEHQLEIVMSGLENQLQRAQEAHRGRWEVALGVGILVFLVFEFFFHLYA
jgi:hypothetical protein